jgi:sulfur-carrier protein
MPRVTFTSALQRHLAAPSRHVEATTVRQALEAVFREHPALRGYVLDDQGRLRPHVQVFVDGAGIADRERLTDPVGSASELYVAQALSGG